MDPNEAWRLYLDATRRAAEAREERREHAENLLRWMDNGGFHPDGFTVADLAALRRCARS